MGPTWLQTFAHTPVGRPFFKVAQPVIRYARRRAHPEVPANEQVTNFEVCGRTVGVRHRRWDRGDEFCLEQCFVDQQYDMPSGVQRRMVQRFYEQILAAGRKPLIVDCGANIGASMIWFDTQYPGSHIVAVEPAPDNFSFLEHNSKGRNAVPILAAIGSSNGSAFLSDDIGKGMGYRVVEHPTDIPIRVLTVKDLISEYDPNIYTPFLLKVDIEGAEKDLFSGDTSVIDSFPVIIMEPHDWLHPGAAISQPFFRYHVASGREFSMKYENVGSLDLKRLTSTLS
jgi:FkbM family methyltransferase